jgi:hypothetical protein
MHLSMRVCSGFASAGLLQRRRNICVPWLEWTWGRVFGIAFLALTALATMGSGQHYFFDLLCAVPYASAIAYLG